MATLQFDVIIELQTDGGYTAYVPSLPGCVSEGDTRAETLDSIREAIEGYLESLEAHGEPVPPAVVHEHERVAVNA